MGTRLIDSQSRKAIPGSGTSMDLTNGVHLVTYKNISDASAYIVNDQVKLCLVSIPLNCPPGDKRGKAYSVTNLRSHNNMIFQDSQHSCGGP